MSLLEVQLFLGIEITPDLRRALTLADQKLVTHFIDNGDAYLARVSVGDCQFIAKGVDRPVLLEQLDLAEANVLSLCKRMLPDTDFSPHSMQLFATSNS